MDIVLAGLTLTNLIINMFVLSTLAETRATTQKLYGFADSVRKRPRG